MSTMIDRYVAARAKAVANNDAGLVRECDWNLARLGYKPDLSPAAAERVEERAEADARPRRGRPPLRRDIPAV